MKNDLSNRIRQARQALELSQAKLSEISGLPIPSLKNYEGGKRTPGGDALVGFAKSGINAHWLLTGEGQMLLEGKAREGHELLMRDLALGDNEAHMIREGKAHYGEDRIQKNRRLLSRLFHEMGDPGGDWGSLLMELLMLHEINEKGIKRILEFLQWNKERSNA